MRTRSLLSLLAFLLLQAPARADLLGTSDDPAGTRVSPWGPPTFTPVPSELPFAGQYPGLRPGQTPPPPRICPSTAAVDSNGFRLEVVRTPNRGAPGTETMVLRVQRLQLRLPPILRVSYRIDTLPLGRGSYGYVVDADGDATDRTRAQAQVFGVVRVTAQIATTERGAGHFVELETWPMSCE